MPMTAEKASRTSRNQAGIAFSRVAGRSDNARVITRRVSACSIHAIGIAFRIACSPLRRTRVNQKLTLLGGPRV
jgi:hypothetical protein